MTTLLAAMCYLGAALNVYFWVKGGDTGALNAGVAVFAFGAAQIVIALGPRK